METEQNINFILVNKMSSLEWPKFHILLQKKSFFFSFTKKLHGTQEREILKKVDEVGLLLTKMYLSQAKQLQLKAREMDKSLRTDEENCKARKTGINSYISRDYLRSIVLAVFFFL